MLTATIADMLIEELARRSAPNETPHHPDGGFFMFNKFVRQGSGGAIPLKRSKRLRLLLGRGELDGAQKGRRRRCPRG
jgi:hypothetical protein